MQELSFTVYEPYQILMVMVTINYNGLMLEIIFMDSEIKA